MYLWTWKMLLFLKVAGQEWWCSTCSTVSNDAMTLHKSIIAPANHRPQTFQHYGHQPAHSKRKPSRIIIKTCHWNLPGQCKKIRCSHAQHQEWKRTPQQRRCTQLVVNQHHRGMKLRLSPLPQDCTSERFLTSSAPVDGQYGIGCWSFHIKNKTMNWESHLITIFGDMSEMSYYFLYKGKIFRGNLVSWNLAHTSDSRNEKPHERSPVQLKLV